MDHGKPGSLKNFSGQLGTVPAQQLHTAFGFLTSSPHTGTVNKLPAWIFLFVLCHLHLFHCIIIFRGGISLVHLSTTGYSRHNFCNSRIHWNDQTLLHVTLCTAQHTGSQQGWKWTSSMCCLWKQFNLPQTPYRSGCPSLIPKMLGNLFAHRADKHQLPTHSEQHPGLEHEQGAGWQQWRQTPPGCIKHSVGRGAGEGVTLSSPWALCIALGPTA